MLWWDNRTAQHPQFANIVLKSFAILTVTAKRLTVPHQSGPGVIAGAAWKTPTAQVGDEAGKNQVDHAAEQDGGVGPLHHPVKHKCLNTQRQKLSTLCDFFFLSHRKLAQQSSGLWNLFFFLLVKNCSQRPSNLVLLHLTSRPHYVHKSAVPSSAFFCCRLHFFLFFPPLQILACLTISKIADMSRPSGGLILHPCQSLMQRFPYTFAFTPTYHTSPPSIRPFKPVYTLPTPPVLYKRAPTNPHIFSQQLLIEAEGLSTTIYQWCQQ